MTKKDIRDNNIFELITFLGERTNTLDHFMLLGLTMQFVSII